MNQIVWADIPVLDLERAIAFYSAVLGGSVTRQGGPGFTFGVLPHADHAVSGCLYKPGPENAPSRQGPLLYFNASGRLHAALQEASAHGGTVLQDVQAIGTHGWRAVLLDSEGNRIALHAPEL